MAALRIAVYEGWAKIEGKSEASPASGGAGLKQAVTVGCGIRWRRLERRRAAKNGRPTHRCIRRLGENRREVTDQAKTLWQHQERRIQ